MEIITDFVHNYKHALHGLNIFIKVLVTLALAFIILSVISAVINVLS